MLTLKNNGRVGKLSVFPKNWKSPDADASVYWYIRYRYYQSGEKPKQVFVKAGINNFHTLKEKQAEMATLLADEIKLFSEGFDPGNGSFDTADVNSSSLVIDCYEYAVKRMDHAKSTMTDLNWVLGHCKKWINGSPYAHFSIKEFSKRHIKNMLASISTSNDRYNKNRTYLMIIYNELDEDEITDGNPVKSIKTKKRIRRIREVLSDIERVRVKERLLRYPNFSRFANIFFHSGGRISEMFRLKTTDIDLTNQRFKVMIKKGNAYREEWKVMKNLSLPYWQDIMALAGPGDFVFSTNFLPGPFSIHPRNVSKKWTKYIQKPLNIKATFYALKHLHSDEIAAGIGLAAASGHNNHKGTVITMTYATNEKKRMQETIKNATNEF